MEYFNLFTEIIFIMALGWYLITNLQWYNYKLDRVVLKHHKQEWHFTYFVFPILIFYLLEPIAFDIFFYVFYAGLFYFWNKRLDRPLVLTSRVKRFLAILLFITFAIQALCLASESCSFSPIFIPLILAYVISMILENYFLSLLRIKVKNVYKV